MTSMEALNKAVRLCGGGSANEARRGPAIRGEQLAGAEVHAAGTLHQVRQFAERHPAFPRGGLRWLIFNERHNGLADSGAIIRVGRKVLIDEPRFFSWLDAQNAPRAT